jgi:hypothetical protein
MVIHIVAVVDLGITYGAGWPHRFCQNTFNPSYNLSKLELIDLKLTSLAPQVLKPGSATALWQIIVVLSGMK